MATVEPPRPQRGTTAQERGPESDDLDQAFADARTWTQKLRAGASPRLVLAQADGYPVGVKQFLQLCLVLIYPAWLFGVLCMVLLAWPAQLLSKAGEALLMLLFWPVRRAHFKKHPEEYAAWTAKHGKKS